MFKSVSLKMAMMFVLLTISIIILIGSFMTESIEEFYENEFGELMSSVFNEDYIAELTTTKLDFIGPKTVPENCVFVLGDNRNKSTDSRNSSIGMVDKRLIIGKVYWVIFPLSEFGWVY